MARPRRPIRRKTGARCAAPPAFNEAGAERDAAGLEPQDCPGTPELMFLYGQIKQLNPGFDSTPMMDERVRLHP